MQPKTFDEYFVEASLEQREAIRVLLKEKAGSPVIRKRRSGSDNESDSGPKWMPYKMCDNCAYQEIQQATNNPHILVQGCPYYNHRKWNEELKRVSCLKWANRKFAPMETENGENDEM